MESNTATQLPTGRTGASTWTGGAEGGGTETGCAGVCQDGVDPTVGLYGVDLLKEGVLDVGVTEVRVPNPIATTTKGATTTTTAATTIQAFADPPPAGGGGGGWEPDTHCGAEIGSNAAAGGGGGGAAGR